MVVDNIVLITISLIMSAIISLEAKYIEGKVVEGEFARIEDYPHSAYLNIECKATKKRSYFSCGSSIINQAILLTAAHCLALCSQTSFVAVYVGSSKKYSGVARSAANFKVHEQYDTKTLRNDIALVKVKQTLKFGKRVRRVSLLREPPYHEPARIAGWGWINDENRTGTKHLMQTSQKVWSRKSCMTVLPYIYRGTFCAGARNGSSYIAKGDSGSALIVRKYIQIGIVSYKIPSHSRSLAVYTDVARYYKWIRKTAKKLYCNSNKTRTLLD